MNDVSIVPLFASSLMEVQLDLDLEKLTEFAFEMWHKDKKGVKISNVGGWQSYDIKEEKNEEFIRLKKKISQYLQTYHLEVFQGTESKEKITQDFLNVWVNINEKHNYNEWHIHPLSTLSGVFYIKHDGSVGGGNILFKHPNFLYLTAAHQGEYYGGGRAIQLTPKSNTLLIFPSWLEHKADTNLKNDSRISLSFNTTLILEKKSQ